MVSISRLWIGLDYHQDSIRVCIVNEHGQTLVNRDCPNRWTAVHSLAIGHGFVVGCAIEACCGAADFAEELREKAQWDVRLAHPGYVRRLKQSPDKSDHDDAYLLADLIRVDYLPEVWLAPSNIRDLRRLVRYRQQLKRSKTNVKLQIRGVLREQRVQNAPANVWTKAWIEWVKSTDQLSDDARWILQQQMRRLQDLTVDIKKVEARMKKATADDPVVQKLLQQPGTGLVTAVTLRAEIGHFERFGSGKQVSRFCGLTPCNASSGKRQSDAGLIRSGNHELRAVLLQAAHRLARYNNKWCTLKERLLKKGKPMSVVIAAVANRWVRWLYHQMVALPERGTKSSHTQAA